MKRILGILIAIAFAAATSAGQITRDYYSGPAVVPVPSSGTGGQAGGPGNPANVATLVANSTDSLIVENVVCYVILNHPRVADLTLSLSHCGTTVMMFPGSLNQSASVSGAYSFSDFAPTPFLSAVNQAQGPVANGPYKPWVFLSAFHGQNATGPWTLTIEDLASGISGTAGNMTVEVTAGTSFGGAVSPNLVIPDGANGNCYSPVTHVVDVPTPGKIGLLYVSLGLTHTYTSDLTIVLSHAGVSATIMSYNTPVSGANLAGTYTFEDEAVNSWAQIVGGLSNSATVAPWFYRPLSPFSAFQGLDQAGPWYLTICDSGTGDVGILSAMTLSIAGSSWDLTLLQPGGVSSLVLANSGGAVGHAYANLISLAPGGFPNGWLYGVDVSINDVMFEISFGPPFFGTLGPCGSAWTSVLGPIPPGLTLYITSLELDGSGSVVNVKPGFAYTTTL